MHTIKILRKYFSPSYTSIFELMELQTFPKQLAINIVNILETNYSN